MSETSLLLALDTATVTASVAIYDLETELLLTEYTWLARRKQTQELMSTAQAMLAQLDILPARLAALAVTTGPGSFTGVRIAISAAKGIGLGLPALPRAIGIPTLAVTAAAWLGVISTVQPPPRLCAMIQAGRGRYNWCFFGPDDLLRRPTAAEHGTGTAEELATELTKTEPVPQPIWLVGELAPDIVQVAEDLPYVLAIDAVSGWRRAGFLARLAALHLASGTTDDLAALQPLYLHAPS